MSRVSLGHPYFIVIEPFEGLCNLFASRISLQKEHRHPGTVIVIIIDEIGRRRFRNDIPGMWIYGTGDAVVGQYATCTCRGISGQAARKWAMPMDQGALECWCRESLDSKGCTGPPESSNQQEVADKIHPMSFCRTRLSDAGEVHAWA
jgi:hypothetical protein